MDLTPLLLTFKLALLTTIILFAIGIPLAYWVVFSKSRLKHIVEPLISLPLVLPPTVIGFYLLAAFSASGINLAFTFTGLVLGSVIFSLPFMVNPIKAGMQDFPKHLIEASYVLGKGPKETLRRVILPNIRPSLWTGIVMAFAHTIGEFGVVLMIGGNIPGQTRVASIAIFSEMEALNYRTASEYALVMVIIAFAILFIFHSLNKKSVRLT